MKSTGCDAAPTRNCSHPPDIGHRRHSSDIDAALPGRDFRPRPVPPMYISSPNRDRHGSMPCSWWVGLWFGRWSIRRSDTRRRSLALCSGRCKAMRRKGGWERDTENRMECDERGTIACPGLRRLGNLTGRNRFWLTGSGWLVYSMAWQKCITNSEEKGREYSSEMKYRSNARTQNTAQYKCALLSQWTDRAMRLFVCSRASASLVVNK